MESPIFQGVLEVKYPEARAVVNVPKRAEMLKLKATTPKIEVKMTTVYADSDDST